MRVAGYILAFLAGLTVMFLFAHRRIAELPRNQALIGLLHSKAAIEKTLTERGNTLRSQSAAFAEMAASNRDFAMKYLVEGDKTAPEVAEIAGAFMPTMALSLLEIADSTDTLLSCGHFPAATGTSVAAKAALLDTGVVFLTDMVRGEAVLTIQTKRKAVISDAAKITCFAGWVVDESFLDAIRPRPGLRLLLRHGDQTMGMGTVNTVSAISDNTMIVNDTTFLATSLTLPFRGEGTAPELYILDDVPASLSLF